MSCGAGTGKENVSNWINSGCSASNSMGFFSTRAHKIRILYRRSMRYDTLLSIYGIYLLPLHCIVLHYPTRIQQQSCPSAASSVKPKHRQIYSSSTAMHASPPCIVLRLVRGKIGGSSTNKSASFSTWGTETCRCGLMSIRADLFF
jgi:hypothetical protein